MWEPLLEAGQDIVSIHLAGGISGTCESARQAQSLLVERGLGERIEVIDGETACGGLGLVLLAAAAAAQKGAEKDAVAARAREARKALKIWFCVDTLEYLRRGGRIGNAQAWIGSTLKIKPILSLDYEINACRAGAHRQARVRAHGAVRPGTARQRRRPLGGAAHPGH